MVKSVVGVGYLFMATPVVGVVFWECVNVSWGTAVSALLLSRPLAPIGTVGMGPCSTLPSDPAQVQQQLAVCGGGDGNIKHSMPVMALVPESLPLGTSTLAIISGTTSFYFVVKGILKKAVLVFLNTCSDG